MSSTLPLFPTDDGWPYPDATGLDLAEVSPDLDALELLGPHVYDVLTPTERDIVFWHYGLQGHKPLSMKELAPVLGCTRGEARELLVGALDKLRAQLSE